LLAIWRDATPKVKRDKALGPIAAYSATVAIDELRVFLRALDADEVKIIHSEYITLEAERRRTGHNRATAFESVEDERK